MTPRLPINHVREVPPQNDRATYSVQNKRKTTYEHKVQLLLLIPRMTMPNTECFSSVISLKMPNSDHSQNPYIQDLI